MADDDLNPTSMLYWWPRLALVDVPMPKTEIVTTAVESAGEMLLLCSEHRGDRETPEHLECGVRYERYVEPILAAVEAVGGYPAFVRTDLYSGKHFWNDTCFLSDLHDGERADQVRYHVMQLLEGQELAMFPPPPGEDVAVRGFVVRELLPVEPVFTAWGGLPITAERRYFVEDGEVRCHHPYWEDEQNIEVGLRHTRDLDGPADWRDRLAEVNAESADEVELLTERSRMVAEALPGGWSVDWLRDAAGEWYLIDMAVDARSWHPRHDRAPTP